MMAGYLTSSFSGGAILGGSARPPARRRAASSWRKRRRVVRDAVVARRSSSWLRLRARRGRDRRLINAFAAARFTPRVITWLHACWGLGAMIGPLVMTAVIASGAGWRWGYALLAGSVLGMAVLPADPPDSGPARGEDRRRRGGRARRARPPARRPSRATGPWQRARVLPLHREPRRPPASGPTRSSRRRAVWPRPRPGRPRPPTGAASSWVAWPSVRSLTTLPPPTLLRFGMAGAPLAALVVCLTRSGAGAFAGLFALGLLLAPIFPLLIAETPARVGERHAAHAIGFQISAATLGAGALPALAGLLARHAGLESLGPVSPGRDPPSPAPARAGRPPLTAEARARACYPRPAPSLPEVPWIETPPPTRPPPTRLSTRSPPTPRRWPRPKPPRSSVSFPTAISPLFSAP